MFVATSGVQLISLMWMSAWSIQNVANTYEHCDNILYRDIF